MTGEEGQLRILLVEDNPGDAELIELSLQQGGLDPHVTRARSLAEARELAAARAFQVTLLDLGLPDARGLETLRATVGVSGFGTIIVLTGLDDEWLATEALKAGAQDYLVKGAEAHQIQRAIRYARERGLVLEQLRKSEARYSLALEGARDGLWDWDLAGETVLSARWKAILDYAPDGFPDSMEAWFAAIHPADRAAFHSRLDQHLEGGLDHFEHEYRMRCRGGDYRWVLTRGAALRTQDGAPYRVAGSQTDVTEQRELRDQLARAASHDALTGLPNRSLLLRLLARGLEGVRQGGATFGLLFLDLDRFKDVNDHYGHAVGDQLLAEFARRVSGCIRPSDTLARLGGDEFVVYLGGLSQVPEAESVCRRILEASRRPYSVGAHDLHVASSIGVVVATEQHAQPEDVLRDADAALYQAKASGKGRYQVFDSAMQTRTAAHSRLELMLRVAVEDASLVPFFQPIVSLETGRLEGAEVLARWPRGEGFVPTEVFIPVAAECGLLPRIGEQMLEAACQHLARWEQEGWVGPTFTLSVNLCAAQVQQRDLAARLTRILSRTAVSPSRVTLELSEDHLHDRLGAVPALRELRERGFRIHVGGFGSGYSSLARLQGLPVDAVKIDRAFVSGESHSELLLRTLVALGNGLGLGVIAEGVEVTEQRSLLRSLGCGQGQGHLFSPALPVQQFVDHLRDELAARRHGCLN